MVYGMVEAVRKCLAEHFNDRPMRQRLIESLQASSMEKLCGVRLTTYSILLDTDGIHCLKFHPPYNRPA